MHEIQWSDTAIDHFRGFRKYDQQRLMTAIDVHLLHQPTLETSKRVRLFPNELAEWELRIGELRVFYDVDEKAQTVQIEAIGYKEGNRLYVNGEEYKL